MSICTVSADSMRMSIGVSYEGEISGSGPILADRGAGNSSSSDRGLDLLRRKRVWLGLAISVACLAFFLARTNLGEIRDSFRGANYALAFAAIPVYFMAFWLRTLRWQALLKPITHVPAIRLYPIALIGLMTNNIAPARVGELVRAYLVGEREKMSKTTALGTIAVDRAFDGLTLVATLGICTAIAGGDARVKSLGVITALTFFAAAAVLIALATAPSRARGLILRLSRLLPRKLQTPIEGLVDSFLSGLIAIRRPSALLQGAVLSVASWGTEATMYIMIGNAFQLDVGLDVYLIITAAPNLALSILASPGGVGPFEVTTREVLVYFGTASAQASAYALALHALLLAPVIIAGFVMLWVTHVSLGQVLGIGDRVEVVTAPEAANSARLVDNTTER
jgi:uncharacterized protein (TIRG00374 family)